MVARKCQTVNLSNAHSDCLVVKLLYQANAHSFVNVNLCVETALLTFNYNRINSVVQLVLEFCIFFLLLKSGVTLDWRKLEKSWLLTFSLFGFLSLGTKRRPLTFWDLDASSQPQRCWVGKKSFEQHFNTILGDLLEDPNANPNSGILKSTTANTQMLKVSFAAIASPSHPQKTTYME
ncbi:unnamed protein product [Musa acuminata subsp. malaccensis]|uniref:(wild Malaysian banana) hypothetical protein n=1 Tax=Musa acuminata subsp. malaccensis TaxID=214687 RepID=A0A8D7A8X3_MUSAM|nr:unnamed protein product [Musa acuminata subsp. malaccensis]